MLAVYKLEGVSPVKYDVGPVAASPLAPRCRRSRPAAVGEYPQDVTRAKSSRAQVGRVIPVIVNTDAHARRKEIPEIPLAQ